ncbi:MAG: DUF2935 domain-containing protein [Oscillospiraceae bacterium]|nr:DUF2935 domain-containing protein [Oscillospiraceae bacterium]
MNTENYVLKSLELHLFFSRIMKEHSLFMEAGYTSANASFAARAEYFKKEFDCLLCKAVSLGDGIISKDLLASGEIVTQFTVLAEKQTQKLSGICINQDVTDKELRMQSNCLAIHPDTYHQVRMLNQTAVRLLNGLITLKEETLNLVLSCQMFTMNYPLLIEHILREAKLYRSYVQMLERDGDICGQSMKEVECFWNRIMMEHALFIRGLLDPTETELFDSADSFADEYAVLLQCCNNAQSRSLTADSLEETKKFRDFEIAGTKGIESCKIRSLILPLLADHVLRESNHFIRILENN